MTRGSIHSPFALPGTAGGTFQIALHHRKSAKGCRWAACVTWGGPDHSFRPTGCRDLRESTLDSSWRRPLDPLVPPARLLSGPTGLHLTPAPELVAASIDV